MRLTGLDGPLHAGASAWAGACAWAGAGGGSRASLLWPQSLVRERERARRGVALVDVGPQVVEVAAVHAKRWGGGACLRELGGEC